jgi:hypothetical protein
MILSILQRSLIVNLHTLNLRTLVLATTALSVVAFAQNPITADSPYQTHYASNLNNADSVINLSNTGASGAGFGSGFTANITGTICVNTYVFAPDEEILACCSCPVTPNGLVALSVQNDLLNNTLSGRANPSSLLIALTATVPVTNSCNNSAAAPGALAIGMTAWLHAQAASAGGTCTGGTETPFIPSTLSAAELNRLTGLCTFAILQGTGFGICNSCELHGLGAAASNQ